MMVSRYENQFPAVTERCERAVALAEKTMSGARGIWGNGGRSPLVWAQAIRENAHEQDPFLRGGRVAARVLELAAVAIHPLHIFAANGIVPVVSATEMEAANAYLSTQPYMNGHSHHISLNYQRLIEHGVEGVLKQLALCETANSPLTAEQQSFYAGTRIALAGLVRYGQRYREEAVQQLAQEEDPQRQAELQRMSDALHQVPAKPARTFYEAIQTMLLLHFASRTHEQDSAVGRFDYYMAPYYERDLAAGCITREEAASWVQLFLAQLLELSAFSDSIVVGGCQADGETPFINDLSYFVLDAVAHLGLPNPQVGFRYTPGHPREFLRRAMRCVQAGTGHPGIFNDPIAIAALERAGMTREEAADYANCNCVELSSCGRSSIFSGLGYFNLLKPLELLLNGGTEMVKDPHHWNGPLPAQPQGEMAHNYPSFTAFLAAYEAGLNCGIDALVQEAETLMHSLDVCTHVPLSSAFIEGCLERGLQANLGGARCNQTFPTFVGFVNAVNALLAIRMLVYEQHRVTLEEMAVACRDNFIGHDDLRALLRNACPRYGNDDARADSLAAHLFTYIGERLLQYRNRYGTSYGAQFFGWQVHAMRGAFSAASADGRLCGEAVSGTLGGDGGTDRSGPTALLASVTAFDHTLAAGGLAVNLALMADSLRTEAGLERIIDLTLAYFAMGGMQIQYNCVSPDTLCDAQHHPDQHAALLVRVAGYSDRFVTLNRELQDDIIQRSLHQMN